jgi:hypothetical protein
MEPEALTGASEAQPTQSEVMRVGARVLGRMITVWAGIRDAYYGSIDQIERTVCAP